MKQQFQKTSLLSLSACSLPVMLAVIGYGPGRAEAAPHSGTASSCYQSTGVADQLSDTRNRVQGDQFTNVQARGSAVGDRSSQRLASWICMSSDNTHFWVSDGQDASISTYRFIDSAQTVELVSKNDAIGPRDGVVGHSPLDSANWVDLELSEDGEYLYQAFGATGAMGVYEVDGGDLTLIEIMVG